MVRERPFLAGQREFAAVYGVQPQMIRHWLLRGALDPDDAIVVSGVRYWPLGVVVRFGPARPQPKPVVESVLEQLKEEQAPGWMAYSADELPPIVGQQEVQSLFRLPTQANVATAIATGRFCAPDWRLSGSPLWLLETVVEHAPVLKETARGVSWEMDNAVLSNLREKRYDGPGSVVLPRGHRS